MPCCIVLSQGVNCVANATVQELMRGIRSQLSELISGLAGTDLAPMSLGLSHSLSRYKLKFSPDKVGYTTGCISQAQEKGVRLRLQSRSRVYGKHRRAC